VKHFLIPGRFHKFDPYINSQAEGFNKSESMCRGTVEDINNLKRNKE
jgi:hypothetical protein